MKRSNELKKLRFYLARLTESDSPMWVQCFNAICRLAWLLQI
jgi:hypothetical protein